MVFITKTLNASTKISWHVTLSRKGLSNYMKTRKGLLAISPPAIESDSFMPMDFRNEFAAINKSRSTASCSFDSQKLV